MGWNRLNFGGRGPISSNLLQTSQLPPFFSKVFSAFRFWTIILSNFNFRKKVLKKVSKKRSQSIMVRFRFQEVQKNETDLFGHFCRLFFVSIFGNFGTKKEPTPTYRAEGGGEASVWVTAPSQGKEPKYAVFDLWKRGSTPLFVDETRVNPSKAPRN